MIENKLDPSVTNVSTVDLLIDGTQRVHLGDDAQLVTVQEQLRRLKDDEYYENVFSWDMKKASITNDKEIEFKTLDKFRKTLDEESQRVVFQNGLEQFRVYK